VLQLSPFQVNATEDRGYAAANTLSGTRLNSRLEDIAGSISVVTKQQLIDTAALDINDIFLFEVGTEGTGQFTDTATDGRGEGVWDNVAGNPTGANRVRGLAAANIAVGGFGASGTIPIDTYNIDAVEISRGSNSSLAGLGETGGTVNLVTSKGNLTRETTQFVGRVDSYGGFRASMDINRPLIKNKLALRFSAVYNETGYIRKPSIDRTDRQQIALTFRPFKQTTINASFERFHEFAVRANTMTPRDSISLWRSRGSPTWDLKTLTYTVNGVRSAPITNNNQLPAGLASGFGSTRVLEFIDAGDIQLITRANNPANAALGLTTLMSMVSISNEAAGGPLYKVSGTTNKAVYDWEEVNMAASAYQLQSAKIFNANLDHSIFNTQRNRLDLQLAWRREDQRDYRRQFIGQLDGVGTTLQIDPNETLPDGRPNPFFLRPFIGGVNPQVFRKPVFNDNYRAQLAYQLDLRREGNLLKWLGMHRAIGYGEYKLNIGAPQNLRYHDTIINPNFNPTTNANGTPRSQANNNDALMYTLFYMGNRGDYGLKYANSGPAQWNGNFKASYVGATSTSYNIAEPVEIREVYFALGTQKKKVRTMGGSVQSFFLNDQVVTTFGRRSDRVATSDNLATPTVNGFIDETNLWNFGRNKRWRFGDTNTAGVVVKPFRGFSFVKNAAESGTGLTRFAGQVVHGFNFYVNKSDSFAPADTAYDVFLRELPNPSGESKEYGFSLSMFDNRFAVRVAHQQTLQINSRANTSVIATRAQGMDFRGSQNLSFNLYDAATGWEQQLNPNFSPEQAQDAAAKRIGYTREYIAGVTNKVIADVSDAVSKGWELELQFNPTRYWTLRATGNQQEAIDKNISSTIQEFIETRLPIWTTVRVPTARLPDGTQLPNAGELWWNLNQGSQGIPANYYNTNVRNALLPLIAGQGKAKPQAAKNSFSLITNYQLAGLGTFADSHRWLKNTTVGGSYRWSSARAIGYLAGAPDADGVVRTLDKEKPVYGKPTTSLDVNLSYRTRLFSNKIGTRFQLNVRNVTESGRLLGVSVNPDGRPFQYRIIDPRQFIFTTTFDL
jgi:hypothetical protein